MSTAPFTSNWDPNDPCAAIHFRCRVCAQYLIRHLLNRVAVTECSRGIWCTLALRSPRNIPDWIAPLCLACSRSRFMSGVTRHSPAVYIAEVYPKLRHFNNMMDENIWQLLGYQYQFHDLERAIHYGNTWDCIRELNALRAGGWTLPDLSEPSANTGLLSAVVGGITSTYNLFTGQGQGQGQAAEDYLNAQWDVIIPAPSQAYVAPTMGYAAPFIPNACGDTWGQQTMIYCLLVEHHRVNQGFGPTLLIRNCYRNRNGPVHADIARGFSENYPAMVLPMPERRGEYIPDTPGQEQLIDGLLREFHRVEPAADPASEVESDDQNDDHENDDQTDNENNDHNDTQHQAQQIPLVWRFTARGYQSYIESCIESHRPGNCCLLQTQDEQRRMWKKAREAVALEMTELRAELAKEERAAAGPLGVVRKLSTLARLLRGLTSSLHVHDVSRIRSDHAQPTITPQVSNSAGPPPSQPSEDSADDTMEMHTNPPPAPNSTSSHIPERSSAFNSSESSENTTLFGSTGLTSLSMSPKKLTVNSTMFLPTTMSLPATTFVPAIGDPELAFLPALSPDTADDWKFFLADPCGRSTVDLYQSSMGGGGVGNGMGAISGGEGDEGNEGLGEGKEMVEEGEEMGEEKVEEKGEEMGQEDGTIIEAVLFELEG